MSTLQQTDKTILAELFSLTHAMEASFMLGNDAWTVFVQQGDYNLMKSNKLYDIFGKNQYQRSLC